MGDTELSSHESRSNPHSRELPEDATNGQSAATVQSGDEHSPR